MYFLQSGAVACLEKLDPHADQAEDSGDEDGGREEKLFTTIFAKGESFGHHSDCFRIVKGKRVSATSSAEVAKTEALAARSLSTKPRDETESRGRQLWKLVKRKLTRILANHIQGQMAAGLKVSPALLRASKSRPKFSMASIVGPSAYRRNNTAVAETDCMLIVIPYQQCQHIERLEKMRNRHKELDTQLAISKLPIMQTRGANTGNLV